jgi:hypothetical protein
MNSKLLIPATLCLLALSGSAAAADDTTIYGFVANLPSANTLEVDIKEAPQTHLINRQVTVRVRGIVASSRSGNGQRDRLQLNGLLLGQKVELTGCTPAGAALLCNVQFSRDQQRELRHDVADLLVAYGLARRQQSH